MSTHTISVFVENHSGALSRVAGLFSSRGYNISSLTVAETEDPTVSRMTILVAGEEEILEQVVKQLNRLVDVIKVVDFQSEAVVERELLLVRVDSAKANRHELWGLANTFGGQIVAVSPTSISIELSGPSDTLEDFVSLVRPYGIKELVRSGRVAMGRARR
jgi:acetolactate synthase-1/3 small subunit